MDHNPYLIGKSYNYTPPNMPLWFCKKKTLLLNLLLVLCIPVLKYVFECLEVLIILWLKQISYLKSLSIYYIHGNF